MVKRLAAVIVLAGIGFLGGYYIGLYGVFMAVAQYGGDRSGMLATVVAGMASPVVGIVGAIIMVLLGMVIFSGHNKQPT